MAGSSGRGGWFANLGVATKILTAVLTVVVVAAVVSAIGLLRMGALNDDLTGMKEQHVRTMSYVAAIRGAMADGYRALVLQLAATTDAQHAEAQQLSAQSDSAVDRALAAYTTAAAGSRHDALDKFGTASRDYRTLRDVVIYRKAPPAGFTMPSDVRGAFQSAETAMNEAAVALEEAEVSSADRMAADATDSYRRSRAVVLTCLVAGLLLALALGLYVASRIKRQVRSAGAALDAVADGDLTRPAEVLSSDEIGAMAAAVNRARDGLRETVAALAGSARTLGVSSGQLDGVAARIAASAEEAAAQANVVAGAAEEVSSNVSTVAAGSQEMGASIREISQNANDAARVAAEAVGVAGTTNRIVSKLGESSTEIGNVVKVITAIAEQTNLLALNATIEAARAGDAGKGFAVVAGEVKDLAQETAKATDDIGKRVQAIQADTENAVEAIGEISRIIGRINDYQVTIASAVEEQTATTSEMSRSVGDASDGSANIATNIGGVAVATQRTTAALTEANATAAELSRVSDELQRVVARFRV
ncbi:methyl-accepting chemotaxis protein [Dactylosporangium sucinum]|uniref:Methyl-accepting chemotaxis protein n=1 Tax=Dactylosporangium sucinum TaxID=1424081 RepID=A0A917WUP4_9ACTN|nr:methyl-accepting chemotaxis protein [Dactylosporangium sucinum]GGM29611.1 methyl-accepting chemotaxis protein [Dactylosporangium sucinum]